MTKSPCISRRDLFRFRLSETNESSPRSPTAHSRRSCSFPVLRPPGAVAEEKFLSMCTKCGDCIKACPHDAIVMAPARLRGAVGTPMINPTVSPCRMCEDMPCIGACETGALSDVLSCTMGTARISTMDCLAYQGSFCSVCSEHCPVAGAIERRNGRPFVNAESCTGCGVCHFVCPAPQNAIAILPQQSRPRLRELQGAAT